MFYARVLATSASGSGLAEVLIPDTISDGLNIVDFSQGRPLIIKSGFCSVTLRLFQDVTLRWFSHSPASYIAVAPESRGIQR